MDRINRGEIWMADFGEPQGDEDHKLHGIRPVVIVSNDIGNKFSSVFHAVPLTSKVQKKRSMPTHIFIGVSGAKGLKRNSIAQCEQLCRIMQGELVGKIGSVSREQMLQIVKGIKVQLGMETKPGREV